MVTKAKPKPTSAEIAKWAVWDAWAEARAYAALNGILKFAEDDVVSQAFSKGDIEFVRKATKKRLSVCGVTKPSFTKVPEKKKGIQAITVKGSYAHAGSVYSLAWWKKHGKSIKPTRTTTTKATAKAKPVKGKARKY